MPCPNLNFEILVSKNIRNDLAMMVLLWFSPLIILALNKEQISSITLPNVFSGNNDDIIMTHWTI